MSVIPLPYRALAIGITLVAALVAAFGAGWSVNGWRKDAEITDLKARQAEGRADQAQAALTDLATAAAKIRTAADDYTTDVTALGAKLDALRKDFKNAKPLPADCRPDDFRVRNLDAAIDAVNEAGTRR